VEDDISVDSETHVVQSLGGAHRGRLCAFIKVSEKDSLEDKIGPVKSDPKLVACSYCGAV
jgi:hypothetical protein